MMQLRIVVGFIALLVTCPALALESPQSLVEEKTEGSHISSYSGSLLLEGEFVYYGPDEDIIGDHVCFYPSKEFARLIPRGEDDRRDAWFCFRDTPKAEALLGIDAGLFKDVTVCKVDGAATVEITNYVADTTEGDVNDLADLVKVHEKSKARAMHCIDGEGERR